MSHAYKDFKARAVIARRLADRDSNKDGFVDAIEEVSDSDSDSDDDGNGEELLPSILTMSQDAQGASTVGAVDQGWEVPQKNRPDYLCLLPYMSACQLSPASSRMCS